MLVGQFGSDRVLASNAVRGLVYRCPACNAVLTVKQGRRVVHHFAHRPPHRCEWAKGETIQHMQAKDFFYRELISRGLHVELEYLLSLRDGTRRADLFVQSPRGRRVVIELQHTTLNLDDLESRANDYASMGIAQIWIPFLSNGILSTAERQLDGTLVIQKYTAKPFVRWINGFNFGKGMWMYHAGSNHLWEASLRPHQLWVERSGYFDETGEEKSSGGYYRESKRWKTLTLRGPHNIGDLRIATSHRPAETLSMYNWPEGMVANFVPSR